MIKSLMLVGLGGFLGSAARYAVHLLIGERWSLVFPWGTFTVNIVGCLLIGLALGAASRGDVMSNTMKLLLVTGFCGGFTTFSAYSMDGIHMLEQGHNLQFFSYALGSVVVGLAATFLGLVIAR
ncbi:MAG: fluoride efflux transporter CrcB [Cyclobacteriaceae bacterium]|nr:fluoride efflux transporter CrcB [Cyclobacteriaceae bacterium]